ncbi:UvrD-helicase domain-containing protein [Streptomyces sp. NPDC047917]|uniref:UvrD-helicase domain-containing protein n=1 Tax=Streptomyces sp. NPDC047917 TaxID=3365491 RepID=UPI003717F6CA
MAIKPTEEQQAACDAFTTSGDLALVAGAGTGKTSTLVLMGAAAGRRRGVYVSFNREIADHAKTVFGPNVECRTAHSFAYRAVGRRYADRIQKSAHLPPAETARRLGLRRDLVVNGRVIKVNHQARLVMGMVRRFCYTTAEKVMARHLEPVNGLTPEEQDYLAAVLHPYAARAWEDIQSPQGNLRFEHDHYLKMWALTRPVLPGEFVLLDEAQDTNPVLEEIFLGQRAQRVCVGDPAQQIYAWRFAKDVMSGFPAVQLRLTKSFRFGPAVAEQANRWLEHAGSDLRLAGFEARSSRLAELPEADAVLVRSNNDAVAEIIGYQKLGVPVELCGGGNALRRIAQAAQQLKEGKGSSHAELFLFRTWEEVQEYVEHDRAAADLRTLVRLVDAYGPEAIVQAVDRLAPKGQGRVVVSTVHKAKGREWARVRIGPGFHPPAADHNEVPQPIRLDEARLAYVAVTRASDTLDMEGLSWLNEHEQQLAALADDSGRLTAQLIALPLTKQLAYPGAPVSRFMARHLPGNQAVRDDYLRRAADLPPAVQPLDARSPNWPSLGHVIDYRLRLSLGSSLGGAVPYGVLLVQDESEPLRGTALRGVARKSLGAAGQELLERLAVYQRRPDTMDDDELTRLCYVASQFERVYREGGIEATSLLAGLRHEVTLDGLLTRVPTYAVDDAAAQMRLAQPVFERFWQLPPEKIKCAPVPEGAADLGGADGDFVLDGLLLDCKSTLYPRRIGREEIYQLAGYTLLDYAGAFGITRVGFYLSRQGALIDWQLEDFLALLGASKPTHKLRQLLKAELWQVGRQRPDLPLRVNGAH